MNKKRIMSLLVAVVMVIALIPVSMADGYSITISETQHGSVAATVNNASASTGAEGQTVVLTATPAEGYKLSSISVAADVAGETLTKSASSSTNFTATGSTNPQGWEVKNGKSLTISGAQISKVVMSAEKEKDASASDLSVSSGSLSVSGDNKTITITGVNAESLVLSSSGNKHWKIKSATVYMSVGEVPTLNTVSTNVRSFTMPAFDVKVSATFEEMPSITATASKYEAKYDGAAHTISVSVTVPESGATIKYRTAADGEYNLTEAPTYTDYTNGKVTVYYEITAEGYKTKTGSQTVEIKQADATDDPSYTVPGTLTATYGQTLADVDLPDGWAWVEDATTSVGNAGDGAHFHLAYTPSSTNYKGIDRECVKKDKTNKLIVEKAAAAVTVAPEPADDLIYNTLTKTLIKAGSSTEGTMLYAVGDTQPALSEFKTELPQASEEATYKVWYYVKVADTDTNHKDTEPAYITVALTPCELPVLEGAKQNVLQSDDGATFRIDSELDNLLFVKLDGRLLEKDKDYKLSSGSTILTLSEDLFDGLALGRHEIFVQFTNGYAQTYFKVRTVDAPTTGSEDMPYVWLSVMLLTMLGLGGILIANRKRFGVR